VDIAITNRVLDTGRSGYHWECSMVPLVFHLGCAHLRTNSFNRIIGELDVAIQKGEETNNTMLLPKL